jgi:thioredoxin reductase (NADPH)
MAPAPGFPYVRHVANESDGRLPDNHRLSYDCVVVGGGPAGLTAALQMARFNRRVLLADSHQGRSTYHQVNHNYLGFPGGIKATELRGLGRRQLAQYPVALVDLPVVGVSRADGGFAASLEGGEALYSRTIIFATGVRDHFPFFPDWEEFVGRSLFWCITCDGYSTRGKRVLVVGNDDHAGVTALQFLQFTSRVTVLSNAPALEVGEPVCAALEEHGVALVVDEIERVDGHAGVIGQVALAGGGCLELDYLFSLQGQEGNSELALSLGVECSPRGFILVDTEQHTNVPGVFAAGDVTRILSHQVATAVHEGNTAATAANYYLYAPWQRHESYEPGENHDPGLAPPAGRALR